MNEFEVMVQQQHNSYHDDQCRQTAFHLELMYIEFHGCGAEDCLALRVTVLSLDLLSVRSVVVLRQFIIGNAHSFLSLECSL